MTYCAAPGHAPCFVAVVADRTPLSDSSVASPATHPGTLRRAQANACSLRPPSNTTLLLGRNRVHLFRVRMQTTHGSLLTASVGLGVLVSSFDARSWWSVPIAALLAGGGAVLSDLQDWHPPGPLFLVFAFAATASVASRISEIPGGHGRRGQRGLRGPGAEAGQESRTAGSW